MITLSDSVTTITLPNDMQWLDEFAWSPVEQDEEYSLTGALIVQRGIKETGRPITLLGGDDACWVPRSKVTALFILLATEDETLILNLHGTEYTVVWRHAETPVDAKPVVRIRNPDEDHKYTLTLRLRESV